MQGATLSPPRLVGNDSRSAAATGVERLPLFDELYDRAAAGGRCVVLDFGPASPASIALFNALHCRLEILDFPHLMPRLSQARDAEEFRSLLQRILPPPSAHPASVVLCWDFLNYLPRGAITTLMQILSTRCRPGALVHALIAYSSPQMPARPCRYRPAGKGAVHLDPGVEDLRDSPRYTPKDLLRCLPRHDIERGMMLRTGFQEYILRMVREEGESRSEAAMDDAAAPLMGGLAARIRKPPMGARPLADPAQDIAPGTRPITPRSREVEPG